MERYRRLADRIAQGLEQRRWEDRVSTYEEPEHLARMPLTLIDARKSRG